MTQEVRTPLDFKTAFLLDGATGAPGQVPTKQADGSIIWATPSGGGGGSGNPTFIQATQPTALQLAGATRYAWWDTSDGLTLWIEDGT